MFLSSKARQQNVLTMPAVGFLCSPSYFHPLTYVLLTGKVAKTTLLSTCILQRCQQLLKVIPFFFSVIFTNPVQSCYGFCYHQSNWYSPQFLSPLPFRWPLLHKEDLMPSARSIRCHTTCCARTPTAKQKRALWNQFICKGCPRDG